MKMSTLFNPLQTEINSIKPFIERSTFDCIIAGNDQPWDEFVIPFYLENKNTDPILVNTKTYQRYYKGRQPYVFSLAALVPNDVIQILSDNVTEFAIIGSMGTFECKKISISNTSYSDITIIVNDIRCDHIDVSSANNLVVLNVAGTTNKDLYLRLNSTIKKIVSFGCPQLTSVHLGVSTLKESIDFSDCPLLAQLTHEGTFDNLQTLKINNTALTIDTVMQIGNDWKSRVGQTPGSITVSTSIFNAMTQEQKNVFINKNINIVHQ